MKSATRDRLAAAVFAAFVLLPSRLVTRAAAQDQPTPAVKAQDNAAQTKSESAPFTGEFENEGVRLTLEQSGQDVTGTLLLGDEKRAIKGTITDGVLTGQVIHEGDTEHFTARFENGKLLITEGDLTLAFERVVTDQPTKVAHSGGLDFTLPIGWSKREADGKMEFAPPSDLFKGDSAVVVEVQDWSATNPITDPVALSQFRTDIKESLATFDEVGEPTTIALGKNSGILLHFKGNVDEIAKVHINVYLRTLGPKIAIVMVIGDEADLKSADSACRTIMKDIVPHGQSADSSSSLVVTCPEGWKMEKTEAGFTFFPPARDDGSLPGDFAAVSEQPWSESQAFFETMTPERVDEEVRITFPKASRVGDLERLGTAETDGVRAVYQALLIEGDDRVIDISLKKLGDKLVIGMWMGTKSLQDSRRPVVASLFESVALAAPAASSDSRPDSPAPTNQPK